MESSSKIRRRKKFNWAPYLLVLPSLIYLALFFAYPMVRGLILAVWEEGALLSIQAEAERGSLAAGQLPRGAQVEILDRQGNTISPEELGQENLITEGWFQLRGQDSGGQTIEGWASGERIRVREEDEQAGRFPVR